MSYDQRCEYLARVFLNADGTETDERAKELAQAIQSAIEDYFDFHQTPTTTKP